MCPGHYERQRKTGDVGAPTIRPSRVKIPAGALCSLGCGRPMHCRTWCKPHYSRWEKTGDVQAHIPIRVRQPAPPKTPKVRAVRFCEVPDCGEKHYIGGHCAAHNYRMRRYGDPLGGHYTFSNIIRSTRHLPPVERFWARVEKNGPLPLERPELGPCWIWLASLNGNGYGQTFSFTEIGQLAHRVAWHLSGNVLIPGMELDHLCRTPACVRPSHAEQVPKLVNMLRGNGWSGRNARKTHCPQGHPFDAMNTVLNARGHRKCRRCSNDKVLLLKAQRALSREDRLISRMYRQVLTGDPCRYCGAPGQEVDHFFPLAKGGTEDWFNLARACLHCNRSKSTRCGTWFQLRVPSIAPVLAAS